MDGECMVTARRALVTGAASGIGRATARHFADEGADVVLTDIDAEEGEAAAAAIDDEAAGEIQFRALDVRDHDAVQTVFESVHEDGGLDVVVNNAGAVVSGDLVDTSVERRDHLVAVNLYGVWNGCRAAVPLMETMGEGAIVNVASTAGLRGRPGLATYAMTKAAVVNFTRAVAGEVGATGVRVNAVCPGTIETAMAARAFAASDDPEAARRRAVAAHPLDRLGRPEEVAAAIAFLCSEAASFITGVALPVDGGASAVLPGR